MSSLKPVIHGRDHLPGGADPIPVAQLQASLFNSAEEHLQVASVSCSATATTTFSWAHYDGSFILDISSPTTPAVVAAGHYAVSVGATIFLPAVEPAGDAFDVILKAVQASPAWPPATPLPGAGTAITSPDTFETIEWTASITSLMAAGDSYSFSLFNRTSYAVNFVAGISIVRILSP